MNADTQNIIFPKEYDLRLHDEHGLHLLSVSAHIAALSRNTFCESSFAGGTPHIGMVGKSRALRKSCRADVCNSVAIEQLTSFQ